MAITKSKSSSRVKHMNKGQFGKKKEYKWLILVFYIFGC